MVGIRGSDPDDADPFEHGPRLSGEEYDRRIVALQEGRPATMSKDRERDLQRRELDLAIDCRLGRNFPAERREALWAVTQRVERRRRRLLFRHLLRHLWPRGLEQGAAGIAGYLVTEFATVLNPEELAAFFSDELAG